MTKRGGSGRRLTYSERWGYLADWVASFAASEHNLGAREMAQDTLDYMDKLDHVTLVKARPVRKGKGHAAKIPRYPGRYKR